jgi:hypothetical protein
MPDPALRQAGKLLLIIGAVGFVVGVLGYGSGPMPSGVRSGFLVVVLIGALLLILGAIAWALGRIPSTVAEAQVNAGLRRIGFVLFVLGALGTIMGGIGLAVTHQAIYPQFGIGVVATVGFYVAVIGAVIVALSHRKVAYQAQPTPTRL